jgi:RimJ/RimL family protein N-acetyltransferase
VRPLHPEQDAASLCAASQTPPGVASIWTYMNEGPFANLEQFRAHLDQQASSVDPRFYAVSKTGDPDRPLGIASYLAIVPEHGTVEIGHIWFGPELQRTPAATEAIFLLAKHAFDDLGYRRLEWKCNALNGPSRRTAIRFGFEFEGVFKNHRVVKGRNRDTAWFAVTDARWPAVRAAFQAWLSPDNFDENGTQLSRLGDLTASERSGL